MIAKRNLSPVQVARYTARPMVWAISWSAVAVVGAYTLLDTWTGIPFPVVGTLTAALAIFIAFRNNTAFARWSEARTAMQSVLVASRILARQVVASTGNGVNSDAIDQEQADAFRRRTGQLLISFGWLLAAKLRPGRKVSQGYLAGDQSVAAAVNPPAATLVELARHIKEGIRVGALGQFDPISLEPQLVALNNAQGVVERIATTPTLRQYDYLTRRGVLLLAALTPFGIISLAPDPVWLILPLAISISGIFIVMSVTGAANDEPFTGKVTDVPVEAVCTELERDVASTVGGLEVPPPAVAQSGYLW